MSTESLISTWCPGFLRPRLERIQNSPTGYRLAKGMFWSMAGVVISRGLMLAASVLVARMLGKTGFGEFGMIRSTVAMLEVFAGFGLGLTATKYVAEFRASDPERAGRIIGLSGMFAIVTGGLMTLGLFIFAPWFAEHVINAPHLAGVLRIGAPQMFICALNSAQTGALSGFEAFRTIARVNLIAGLISFPLLVGGTYFGGLNGAVWALTVNFGIAWLLNHVAIHIEARRYKVPLTFTNCISERSILWKFSVPAFLSGAVDGPAYWACSALLVNRPGGYSEMGVYNAAMQWYYVLIFIPSLLNRVLLPVFSDQLGQKETNLTKKTLILSLKINALVALPIVVFGSIASPYIMNMYGESFRSGWSTLIFVLFAAGLIAVLNPVGQIIAAVGRMWIGFAMNATWALAIIVSTLLLIDLGSLGLSAARLISYIFHATWTIAFAFWFFQKKEQE